MTLTIDKDFALEVETWVENAWETVVSDIDALVKIESTEDLDRAYEGAPFGPGPRASLSKALEIASDMGFDTHDVDGYMGYAEMPGLSDTQVGIICHTDVVPAGPGWTFPPFEVTRKDGYLIGRGVIDDKGPLMCALHAMRFWHDRGEKLPATVRMLFGADEECGMKDVPYYRERYADPVFLFTPDAEFPVCYGEKGHLNGAVTSARIERGAIVAIEGGTAANAVPGVAHAIVRVNEGALQGELPQSVGIATRRLSDEEAASYQESGDGVLFRIDAKGKSAHASTPELGTNALGILFRYLVDQKIASSSESRFLELALDLIDDYSGAGWGLACSDEDFGPLTAVGSVISRENARMTLLIDIRYPTVTTSSDIKNRICALADKAGATFEITADAVPFLAGRDAPEVQALIEVYNEVTGEEAHPFTMGGGTYAREFSRGVSFGVEKPWVETPAWVGGMHGPDEAVCENLLKQATVMYIHAIKALCDTVI